MNAPGKGLLKVVSILYIVFGALWALFAIIALFGASLIGSMFGNMFGFLGAGLAGMMFVVLLIPAAVNLVVGIIGVKKADIPSAATFFIVFGIILTVLTLISVFGSFSVWSLLALAMPVLLMVGGFMNKKAA